MTGTLGYWLCMMLLSENLLWGSLAGSVINLMSVTIERYLKVVHHRWSKKLLRKWVIILAAAFAWISGITTDMAAAFSTSAVVDGVCYGFVFWESRVAGIAYGIWTIVSFYVLEIFIFVFCYWRILVVIRRQARVMAAHGGPGSSTHQTQSQHIQSNVIKTMIIVSAFYTISWMPDHIYYLMVNIGFNLTLLHTGHYITNIVAFVYICANPFIYATKFDPVRLVLVSLIPCKKTQPSDENIVMGTARTTEPRRPVPETRN